MGNSSKQFYRDNVRRFIPEPVRKIIRFVRYTNERKKVFREISIRREQNRLLKEKYNPSAEGLIIFIVPGASWFTGQDEISGGILSIASIYEETEKRESLHGCKTIMVTYQDTHLLLKHLKFPNSITVFRFNQPFRFFKALRKLIIHISDYLVEEVGQDLQREAMFLKSIPDVQLNILNQNIKLMPQPEVVTQLRKLTSNVTQTTAHEKYSTAEIHQKYGIPLHHLSVFGSPEKYNLRSFENKEDIVVVSPDQRREKESILKLIDEKLPRFRQVIIQDMPYMTYLDYMSRAKFAITFGEGLDFYFIEMIFSGGVGVAVYNEDFFKPEFLSLPGIFKSYGDLAAGIVSFMEMCADSNTFASINRAQHAAVASIYKYNEYIDNIEKFYRREYTFK